MCCCYVILQRGHRLQTPSLHGQCYINFFCQEVKNYLQDDNMGINVRVMKFTLGLLYYAGMVIERKTACTKTVNFIRRVMDQATLAFVQPEYEEVHILDFDSIVLVLGGARQFGGTHRKSVRGTESISKLTVSLRNPRQM